MVLVVAWIKYWTVTTSITPLIKVLVPVLIRQVVEGFQTQHPHGQGGDSIVSLLYLSTLSFHNRSGSHDIAEQFLTVTTTTSNLNHNTFRWGSKTRHFYYFYVCSLSVVVLFWDGWEFTYFNSTLIYVFLALYYVLFCFHIFI